MPDTKIIARPWKPQDLIDDLQGIIDEECDNYLNTRRTTLCMARDYLKEYFATDNNDGRKWISVKDRLPDKKKVIDGDVYYRNVAVRVKNLLHERIAYYDPEHECWYDTGFFQIRGVTHWVELPEWEPPKGE